MPRNGDTAQLHEAHTSDASAAPAGGPDRVAIEALRARLRASGAEHLADAQALTAALDQYAAAYLHDLDGEVARLRRRLEQAERARDELAWQLQASRAAHRRAAAYLQRLGVALSQHGSGGFEPSE